MVPFDLEREMWGVGHYKQVKDKMQYIHIKKKFRLNANVFCLLVKVATTCINLLILRLFRKC